MHIGMIGGIGPAATEYYYRLLAAAHESADKPMELTIVHAQVRDLVGNVTANNPERQAAIFKNLIERLARAGADTAVVTSMTGHFCVDALEPISPLPIVSALPAVNAAIKKRGFEKVGLIGTHKVMGSSLYGAISDASVLVPEGADRDRTHDAYMKIALDCVATDAEREVFFEVGRRLCEDRGAEAVILGGTDLFLAFEGKQPGFEAIDCAQIHVDELTRLSLADQTTD
ncbi:MAG: aspartate/glutamate racemase family protein [Pseudomonadota bacterium]